MTVDPTRNRYGLATANFLWKRDLNWIREKQRRLDHGFYIRWLLISLCAHME